MLPDPFWNQRQRDRAIYFHIRTKHLRFNNFEDREKIPQDTPYSSLIGSDVPIVVEHTRLDSRQAENALLTTIAFPCD